MTAAKSLSRRTLNLLQCLLLGGAMCALPGCFRVTALIPDSAPAETHTHWVNGFFWGAVGGTVDTAQFCGGRPVSSITTKRSIGNYLVELITLGIYSPSKISVTCGQPRWGGGYPQPGYAPAYPPPYQPSYPPYGM